MSYAGLFFVVVQFDHHFKKKLRTFLFVDGLVIVVLGYLQYFFYPSLKSLYALGWDEHMYRLFSVFLDPNFAGAFFVCYFIFIAGMVYESFPNRHSGKRSASRMTYRVALIIVLVLALGAIFLTYSRSALLMLLLSSAVFLVLIQKKKLLLLLVGIMLAFTFSISSFFYIENINLFREASSKARLGNYGVAIKIITDRPVFGVGFNSYRYAKDLYGIQHGWTNAPSHADAGVDNSFLFVLATTGIVGFAAYCWLLVVLLKRALFLFHKKQRIIGAVVFASLIGLFISASFINSLFFPALLLWLWVLLGIMEEE
jgi:O-antigen ligase